MARRGIPPTPIGVDLRTWAMRLVEHLQGETGDETENRPTVVQLPHLLPGRRSSAAVDGQLMYDPVLQKVVVSIGGAWVVV